MFEDSRQLMQETEVWGKAQFPHASVQQHAAFKNSVFYACYRKAGPFGGPSLREHAATYALTEVLTPLEELPLEELFLYLAPVVYGPLTTRHVRIWATRRGTCFHDDPGDLQFFSLQSEKALEEFDNELVTTKLPAQTLDGVRIIAALLTEQQKDTLARLVRQELRRLGLHGQREISP